MPSLSSLVFPSLDEISGDPVLAEGEVLPVRWTEEMLAGLDWRRLVEISRALAVFSGYEPGATRITPDGSAEFSMIQGTGITAWRVVVRLAPWNRWMAAAECIVRFAAELGAQRRTRGVYLAPGGFSPSAVIEATRRGIEMVDAATLADRLNGLPREHGEHFHDITFSGEPHVPTCPVCLRPLARSMDESPGKQDFQKLPDKSYAESDIVADPVVARRVEVLKDCEVHFLREVRARDVIVHGMAVGDFVCEGSLLLNPGAVLCGHVAARSVLVRPGAELRGETRILKGELGTVEKTPESWIWSCGNLPPRAGCEQVAFMPH